MSLAICLWPSKLASTTIIMHIDNQALVSINKMSSKFRMVMALVRPLVVQFIRPNTLFLAEYIYAVDNVIADAISRKQWL